MTTLLLGLLGAIALTVAALVLFTLRIDRRVAKGMPPTGRFLDVEGERIHYVEAGEGPAVVCIHGLTGQLGNFAHGLLEPLSAQRRVVLVDRPGAGHSTRARTSAADLSHQADAIAGAIRALPVERPLLVGHSLGGAVALTLAVRHPGLVRGVALVAPLTQPGDAVPAAFRLLYLRSRAMRHAVGWTLAVPLAILRRRAVLDQAFGPDRAPGDFGSRGGGFLSMRPRSFVAASADLVEGASEIGLVRKRFGEIAVPVAVLFGREDRILSPQKHGGGLVADIRGATLDLIDGGHMIPVTAPDEVARWIRRFDDAVLAGEVREPQSAPQR